MEQEPILKRIDDAANQWNKTKDPQYKDLWYKLIKEFADGTYYPKPVSYTHLTLPTIYSV